MGKTKILLVEDDPNINKLITDYMTAHGFDVSSFVDGPEALDNIQKRGLPHIALIDLTLPTMHGFDLSSRLKSMADVPIIFITATSDTETVVQGLKKYAEDFIVKPFELRELEARIQVVLARMPSLDYANEPIIPVDDKLSIDFAHNRIVINSKSYTLTPTESKLLSILLRNSQRVVENRQLIARVWPSEEVYEDTLRVHMHRLRRKLEADSHHPHYIRTERGIGYMFTVRPPDGVFPDDEDGLADDGT
ncbi:MAG: response regulator transcription factor [Anaerolineae bacterium]|nr:response regulator transcription factor [Anaerolineae bacterium]MCK6578426.1 response regulator transcription factor [Anaerolineae bacterium]NUQ03134.1 response regulator transcription factor [Anaerolineae bacterium]